MPAALSGRLSARRPANPRAAAHELVDSGKMPNGQFHDARLKENSIPIEMMCASFSGEKLTRDYSRIGNSIRAEPVGMNPLPVLGGEGG